MQKIVFVSHCILNTASKVVLYNQEEMDAEEALRNILSIKDPKRITPDLITQAVSDFYGVTPADVRSSKRNREIALPRQIAMYLTRDMTDLSLPRIGDAFGGRDHTTVMHACDKIAELAETDEAIRAAIQALKK